MASIRRRTRGGAGYYVVDVSVTENGRTRRRQRHFRIDPADPGRARLEAEAYEGEMTRKVARAKLAKDRGRAMGPADVEVADWLDRFAIAVRPNMGGDYHDILTYTLNKLHRHLAEQSITTTGQLRREHWAGFVEAMRAKGNKSKSIHNDLSAILRAVRWGIDEGYLEPILARAFPRVRVVKRGRRALTAKEIDALVHAAKGKDILGPILVSVYSGGRRGEIAKLLASDVDLSAGVIHYRAEITKSGEAGDVPIHPKLRPYLEQRAHGDGLLLRHGNGKPWRPDELGRTFTELVRQPEPEGLDWQDVTFHCLRHTFGTRLAASGKVSPFELQRLMRHKSITTSMLYVRKAQVKLPDVDVF